MRDAAWDHKSWLPKLTRPGVRLIGPSSDDVAGLVTICGAKLPDTADGALIDVEASDVVVRRLRFTEVGFNLEAITINNVDGARMSDTWIDCSVFDDTGVTAPTRGGIGVTTDFGVPGAPMGQAFDRCVIGVALVQEELLAKRQRRFIDLELHLAGSPLQRGGRRALHLAIEGRAQIADPLGELLTGVVIDGGRRS